MNMILEFIYCMFYVCSITFCVYPHLDKKPKKSELVIFVFVYSFFDFIITHDIVFDLQVYYVQSFLVVISDFFMISLLNRNLKLYMFYYTIMFYNIFNCIVVFINYLLNYYDGFHILFTLQPSILRFCLVIIFNILSIIIFHLFYRYKVISKKLIIKENYKILIFINLSVQLAYIIFDWLNKMEYINGYVHIILLIFILLWVMLLHALNNIFILNEEKTKNVFINGVYENIEQYIKHYQQDEEKIRKIKHDMKNHFLTIKKIKGEEKIHQYIDTVYSELSELTVLNTEQSGNIYVDAIIDSKKMQYPSVSFICQYNISQLKMNDVDLSMLLFNLVDNACYAAEKIQGSVYIKLEYVNPHFIITIKNSKEGEVNFYSQKGKGHGYGMIIIDDIVEKYSGKIEYEVSEIEVKTSIIMLIN